MPDRSKGFEILNDRFRYKGELSNGIPHGKGTIYYFKEKLQYKGDFRDGIEDGEGEVTFCNGSREKGIFVNQQLVSGTLYKSDDSKPAQYQCDEDDTPNMVAEKLELDVNALVQYNVAMAIQMKKSRLLSLKANSKLHKGTILLLPEDTSQISTQEIDASEVVCSTEEFDSKRDVLNKVRNLERSDHPQLRKPFLNMPAVGFWKASKQFHGIWFGYLAEDQNGGIKFMCRYGAKPTKARGSSPKHYSKMYLIEKSSICMMVFKRDIGQIKDVVNQKYAQSFYRCLELGFDPEFAFQQSEAFINAGYIPLISPAAKFVGIDERLIGQHIAVFDEKWKFYKVMDGHLNRDVNAHRLNGSKITAFQLQVERIVDTRASGESSSELVLDTDRYLMRRCEAVSTAHRTWVVLQFIDSHFDTSEKINWWPSIQSPFVEVADFDGIATKIAQVINHCRHSSYCLVRWLRRPADPALECCTQVKAAILAANVDEIRELFVTIDEEDVHIERIVNRDLRVYFTSDGIIPSGLEPNAYLCRYAWDTVHKHVHGKRARDHWNSKWILNAKDFQIQYKTILKELLSLFPPLQINNKCTAQLNSKVSTSAAPESDRYVGEELSHRNEEVEITNAIGSEPSRRLEGVLSTQGLPGNDFSNLIEPRISENQIVKFAFRNSDLPQETVESVESEQSRWTDKDGVEVVLDPRSPDVLESDKVTGQCSAYEAFEQNKNHIDQLPPICARHDQGKQGRNQDKPVDGIDFDSQTNADSPLGCDQICCVDDSAVPSDVDTETTGNLIPFEASEPCVLTSRPMITTSPALEEWHDAEALIQDLHDRDMERVDAVASKGLESESTSELAEIFICGQDESRIRCGLDEQGKRKREDDGVVPSKRHNSTSVSAALRFIEQSFVHDNLSRFVRDGLQEIFSTCSLTLEAPFGDKAAIVAKLPAHAKGCGGDVWCQLGGTGIQMCLGLVDQEGKPLESKAIAILLPYLKTMNCEADCKSVFSVQNNIVHCTIELEALSQKNVFTVHADFDFDCKRQLGNAVAVFVVQPNLQVFVPAVGSLLRNGSAVAGQGLHILVHCSQLIDEIDSSVKKFIADLFETRVKIRIIKIQSGGLKCCPVLSLGWSDEHKSCVCCTQLDDCGSYELQCVDGARSVPFGQPLLLTVLAGPPARATVLSPVTHTTLPRGSLDWMLQILLVNQFGIPTSSGIVGASLVLHGKSTASGECLKELQLAWSKVNGSSHPEGSCWEISLRPESTPTVLDETYILRLEVEFEGRAIVLHVEEFKVKITRASLPKDWTSAEVHNFMWESGLVFRKSVLGDGRVDVTGAMLVKSLEEGLLSLHLVGWAFDGDSTACIAQQHTIKAIIERLQDMVRK